MQDRRAPKRTPTAEFPGTSRRPAAFVLHTVRGTAQKPARPPVRPHLPGHPEASAQETPQRGYTPPSASATTARASA